MKRVLRLVLCICLLFVFTSCDSSADSTISKEVSSSETSVVDVLKSETSESKTNESVEITESSEEIVENSSEKEELKVFTLDSTSGSFDYGSISTVNVSNIDFEYVTVMNSNKDDVDYVLLGIGKTKSDGTVRPSGYLQTKTELNTMKTVKIRQLYNSSWTGDIKFEVSTNGADFTVVSSVNRVEVSDGLGSNPQRIEYSYDVDGYSYFRVSQAADKFGQDYGVYIEKLEILY